MERGKAAVMYDAEVVRDLFERWGYDSVTGEPGQVTSRWMVPHVNHMILDKWATEPGRALDAGCGRGIEAVKLARIGFSVTAVDISHRLLRHARRRAELAGVADRVEFIQADLTARLPLPDDHFDLCLALTGVLGHVGDRHRDAAANLIASCKPGGLLILGVQSYLGKIRQYLAGGKIDEAYHLADTSYTHTVSDTFEDYCFRPDELVQLFGVLGCRLEEITSAPTIAADGYNDLPDDEFARVLEIERRFLGTPELLGHGEQLVGVFRKG